MKHKNIFFIVLLISCAVGVHAQQTNAEGCVIAKKKAQETYDQGKYEEAKRHLGLALSYCGDDAEVKSLISKCDAEIKKKAEAEALRRKEAEEKRLAEERAEKVRLARIEAERLAEVRRQQNAAQSNSNSNFSKTINGYTFEMVYVEGGTFTMGCTTEQGSDCYDDEKPAHQVTLSGYYIGKTEVTQGQWDAVMGKNNGHGDWVQQYGLGDNYPAYYISWNDIQQFITKLNNMQTQYTYRLPTEAEWEFAARGGNKSRGFKYSGSNNAGEVAWYTVNSGSKTHPVGQKGGNELGLYDMSGNVWEWCQDWFGGYSINAQTNPRGPSTGSYRVFRGGSWNDNARSMRVTGRYYGSPGSRSYSMGFRLACSPR